MIGLVADRGWGWMSLEPWADRGVPELTARVVRASFPKGTLARLQSLLRQAGRHRGIEAEVSRLHEVLHREYLHQPAQVEAALGRQTTALLRQLDAACTNAEELEIATVQAFEQHPDAPVITSFPGLGSLTGARVLAEIGDDQTRFADEAL